MRGKGPFMSRVFGFLIAALGGVCTLTVSDVLADGTIEAKPEHTVRYAHDDILQPSGAEPDWERINSGKLGSKDNPVRAYLPAGEVAYLTRLECQNGSSLAAIRTGSVENGPYGHVLDRFEVKCPGTEVQIIYMDMYHPNAFEMEPVEGFKLN